MIGQKYRDMMDPSRTVVPIKQGPEGVRCRVFFAETGYVGQAWLPLALFGKQDRNGPTPDSFVRD